MMRNLSRRRFIGICASGAGFALLPFGSTRQANAEAVTWRGRALGAPAELILHHPDRALASRLTSHVMTEIDRLEDIFSLYRPGSAISILNRFGVLASPPRELVELLELCRAFHARTDGLFDPTIQPLWKLYAQAYSDGGSRGPSPGDLKEALDLVGFDRVVFNRQRIAFARKGMSLTLNGIAQGYITDSIIELLRNAGMTSTLADIGEVRALGARGDGAPWRVAVTGAAAELDLANRAIATSSSRGFRFGGEGSPGHMLDPRDGQGATLYDSVSVVAPLAVTADALSTAFSFMDASGIDTVLAGFPDVGVRLPEPNGEPADRQAMARLERRWKSVTTTT